mmetsp:Transcript_7476/g.15019  ORF Transcript_7476/g.15019 Transcript_7476/m.15019 type:complete len:122 (-) Transcript_7476:17-382(-)
MPHIDLFIVHSPVYFFRRDCRQALSVFGVAFSGRFVLGKRESEFSLGITKEKFVSVTWHCKNYALSALFPTSCVRHRPKRPLLKPSPRKKSNDEPSNVAGKLYFQPSNRYNKITKYMCELG